MLNHKVIVVAGLVLAFAAWAGSRAAETDSATVPSGTTCTSAGVAINDSSGCRASVRRTDGGTINSGKVAYYYCDSTLGWVPSSSALDCTLDSNRGADGGASSAHVCPDLVPQARFGRVAAVPYGIGGPDAGAVGVTTRIECWGGEIP